MNSSEQISVVLNSKVIVELESVSLKLFNYIITPYVSKILLADEKLSRPKRLKLIFGLPMMKLLVFTISSSSAHLHLTCIMSFSGTYITK